MTIAIRLITALLFVETFLVGGWNALAPESFYRDFPTVDLTPPFSEHYARDFGWALLGIALLLGWAAVVPRTHYVVPAAVAYAVFAVALTAGNALVAVLAIVLVLLAVLRDRRRRGIDPGLVMTVG